MNFYELCQLIEARLPFVHTPDTNLDPKKTIQIIHLIAHDVFSNYSVESSQLSDENEEITIYGQGRQISLSMFVYSTSCKIVVSFDWYSNPEKVSSKDNGRYSVSKQMQSGSKELLDRMREFFEKIGKYRVWVNFSPVESSNNEQRRGPFYDKVLTQAGYVPLPGTGRNYVFSNTTSYAPKWLVDELLEKRNKSRAV